MTIDNLELKKIKDNDVNDVFEDVLINKIPNISSFDESFYGFISLDNTVNFKNRKEKGIISLKGKMTHYKNFIKENLNEVYEYNKKNKNTGCYVNQIDGLRFFVKTLLMAIRKPYKYGLSKNDTSYLKNSLFSKFKEIGFFRLSHKVYKELNKSDKKLIDCCFLMDTKNNKYFLTSNYIDIDLKYNLESRDLVSVILNYRLYRVRKNISFKGKVRDNKSTKRVDELIERIKKIKNENKKIELRDDIQKIQLEINKKLSHQINISEKMVSVSIFDKRTNNFLLFEIENMKEMKEECSGLCDYRNKKIVIKKVKSKLEYIVILFHEIGHMYDYFINYKVMQDCKSVGVLRDSYDDISVEFCSILFEKIALNILAKNAGLDIESIYYYESLRSKRMIENYVFSMINKKIKNNLMLSNFFDEKYFYEYLLFRNEIDYLDCEIEEGVDVYSYGCIKSEKYLKEGFKNWIDQK